MRRRAGAYTVKAIFTTLQGEGKNTGRLAVFCRFAGCNLWSGHEVDRRRAACRFCDTDFLGTDGPGGGRYESARALAEAIVALWPNGKERPFVVFTGGEPTLQLDEAVTAALHASGVEIAIETNGTRAVPAGVDWICVSPKASAPLRQRHGQELKVVWPQAGLDLAELERLQFEHFLLQPLDDRNYATNLRAVRKACEERPRWSTTLQVHKLLGIP